MAATQTPEQRELILIGKVEMRIALADSDSKLELTLKTYLPPLLLKLASDHQSVRNKVISVCQHISTRIKPQSIQLPVAALVKQFQEQENSLIRHFDLLYIQQGVGRLSNAEKAELLPVVVKDISKSGSHAPQIFNLFLRLLEYFSLPVRASKEDTELRQKLGVTPEDTSLLARSIGRLLLFTPQKGASATSPGLSHDEHEFLSLQGKDDVWNPSAGGLNLLRTKIAAARFLASGIFDDKERFLPALFASSDAASNVSDIGEEIVKRAMPAIDLEDEQLTRQLFDLYFGTSDRPRVRVPLRLKILGLLTKSTRSTTFAYRVAQIVDDGIASPATDGEDTVMGNSGSNTSLGRETIKLRAAVFSYITFVARYGNSETLASIATQVVNRLRDFIENQGWPKPGPNEDLVSRGYAYEVIGLLAKSGPRSVLIEEEHPSLDLLRWLFASLATDSSGSTIIVSIEETLSTLITAIARLELKAAEQTALENLLIEQMEQSSDLEANKRLRSTRYVTIRFANRCLPYSSTKARWIDVLGLGAVKDRGEVREEAERGLSPYWYRMLNGMTMKVDADVPYLPTFAAVMTQFFEGRTTSESSQPMALAESVRRAQPHGYQHIVAFARRILFASALQNAGIAVDLENEWERKIDAAAESDPNARNAIRAYLSDTSGERATLFQTLLCALFENLISSNGELDGHLVEFLALAPEEVDMIIVDRSGLLLTVLKSNNQSRRAAAAHAYGILSAYKAPALPARNSQVDELLSVVQEWQSATGSASSYVNGATLALGYHFSRCAYRGVDLADNALYADYVRILLKVIVDSRDNLLKIGGYSALGQLCLYNCVSVDDMDKHSSVRRMIDSLAKTAKDGNEPAIICLGQLSMVLPEDEAEDSNFAYLMEQIHKLHEVKQSEVHFSVGEAMSYVAIGWDSDALKTKLDMPGPKPQTQPRSTTLTKLLDRTLADCANTKPALKKAAVIWLLCLVQFCGSQKAVQDNLTRCQTAFKRCLSDRDELIQETASRGLGLVYEKGDRGLKDDLVRDLVSSFSSDRQSQLAGSVSADTQLFEPGALPTGDGSVSTYKDIMSLASEVGDSSLVYRFMSMASSNAIWSSRAAFGRFGLSSVLSDSSVDGYLANNPKLYPKLFRYRFDPNGGVQKSMNEIWNALVKDSAATIDQHFAAIMEDLLVSILGKEWRVRQASCAAIADLVSGRPLEKYEVYLERIWTQCFKVLDDIKESVRAAAASLARTLTGVLTRTLEADHSSTKNAGAMLKNVLPFLLSPSGMESSAKEVQVFAVVTLLEIIKKANGTTLRPFIPELVERLIGLLSTLENEAVNYVHMNASKYNLTEQKIDDMRLSSVRSSPLMEAIERCLDLLDDDTMRALQPRLENAMKSAVGLPSKVGASRVLVSLCTRRPVVFRPFADDFLKLIEKLVLDRNETVASSYAAAAGYVARGASDKQILRTMTFAKRLYFESEGDREGTVPRRSITAGELMFALSKHASDRFNALASAALPFVFVAKHDTNEQVKDQFQETWNESVGGSRAVLLYLTEILELCSTHLDSPQWALKHATARAVADTITSVSTLESQMPRKVGEQLWPVLEKALGGKTWEGKEVVLFAFVKFVETAQSFYLESAAVKSNIIKIAVREAKRQNANYRQHSVKALGQVALARVDVDMSEIAFEIAEQVLKPEEDADAMEIDGDKSRQSEDMMAKTRAAAVQALFSAINPAVLQEEQLKNALQRALALVSGVQVDSAEMRRTLFTSIAELFDRVRKENKGSQLEIESKDLIATLFGSSVDTEALRMLRADAALAVSKSSPAHLGRAIRDAVSDAERQEVSPMVRERLKAALKETE